MFQEPAGYFEEEKQPTFVQHELADGTVLNLRLVGHNPLWVSRVRGHSSHSVTLSFESSIRDSAPPHAHICLNQERVLTSSR